MKPRAVERKAYELIASSIRGLAYLEDWTIAGAESRVKLPYRKASRPGEVTRFMRRVEAIATHRPVLKVKISGGALLRIGGSAYAGLDPAHTYVPVPKGSYVVEIEATPSSLAGVHWNELRFDYSFIADIYWEGFIAGIRLLAVYDYLLGVDEGSRRRALSVVEKHLAGYRLTPSPGQLAAAGLLLLDSSWEGLRPRKELPAPRFEGYFMAGTYNLREARGLVEQGLTPSIDLVKEVSESVDRVVEDLSRTAPEATDPGVLHAIGHSHLDVAWLWTVDETRRRVLRTSSTALMLLKEFPGLVYGQHTGLFLEWIEKDDPGLLEEIRKMASLGRWVPLGGVWVEGELQIVDGESIARQLLYGQRTFQEKLGLRASIGWLPDNFGYPASLPQLLKGAGLEALVIQKVMWNESTEFPYHAFLWEGVDGSVIPVQLIPDREYDYNAPMKPSHIIKYWSLYRGRGEAPHLIYPFGYGDGGGGPTIEMAVNATTSARLLSSPRVVLGDLRSFMDSMTKPRGSLPRWRGELYLELHRGTFTTNIVIKDLVSRSESLLRSIEILGVIAEALGVAGYPEAATAMWKTLLTNEFHDILPGTSIPEVYERSEEELSGIIKESEDYISRVLSRVSESGLGGALVLYNDLPWTRSGVVMVKASSPPMVKVPCQRVGNGYIILVDGVPSMGIKALAGSEERCLEVEPREPVAASEEAGGGIRLGNGVIEAVIGPDALLKSLKVRGRELIRRGSNELRVHLDEPGEWDAWDIDRESLEIYEPVEVVREPRITLDGPLRACANYTLSWGSSLITQEACIDALSPTLDYYTRALWRDRHVLVKAWFHADLDSPRHLFEIPFAFIERSRDELEGTKFEVPALRWAGLHDGSKGLAIISYSRHGYSVKGSSIGLSLIKKPSFPNPRTDEGEVRFAYSLYPHLGSPLDAGVHMESAGKWSPLKALYNPHSRGPGGEYSLAEVSPTGSVFISAIKKSEEGGGYVVRLYNAAQQSERVSLKLNWPNSGRVILTNILEDPLEELKAEGGVVRLHLRGFEVKTLKVA